MKNENDVKGSTEKQLDDRDLEAVTGGGKHSKPGAPPAGPQPAQIPRHGHPRTYWG